MRQSLGVIALILFVAGISFVLSAQDQQGGRPLTITPTVAAEVPNQEKLAAANDAQIHEGAVDKADPPVVKLTQPRPIPNRSFRRSAQKFNRR